MSRRIVVTAALAAVVACELPFDPPMWEQTWAVPIDPISVGVVDALLPGGVHVNADTTAFLAQAPGMTMSFSLGELCGVECQTVDSSVVAPKPEFGDTLTATSPMPSGIVSASLSGGSFSAAMAHNFSFDPLRPTVDTTQERGHIVVRISSNGNIVARDSIDGADTAFPPGDTLFPSLAVQPVDVSDTLDVWVAIYSPPGDDTEMAVSDTFGITIDTSTIEVAEATVNAAPVEIDTVDTNMDFGGVDSTLVDRIQEGALRLGIENPVSVTGSLDVAFEGDGFSYQRTLPVQQGTYQASMEFTGTELKEILASANVSVLASGGVTPVNDTITLRPDLELVLNNRFDLVVLIGPTEDM